MFRLNGARMPRIKTRASANQQQLPSPAPQTYALGPLPCPPKLRLIRGGKDRTSRRKRPNPFQKKEPCGFCEKEKQLQEEEALKEWRRGVAFALGHKNPDRIGQREIVMEDMRMEMEGRFTPPRTPKHYK